MPDLYSLARPFIMSMPPERAHGWAIRALKWGLASSGKPYADPVLETELFGLSFPNPIGLAAGFDKNAEVPDALLKQGFGFVEVGTVTPNPQEGNAKPRMFRLPEDRAVINRLGFNNDGLDAVKTRLVAREGRLGILGANIGANKTSKDRIADYAAGIAAVARHVSYVTVNISSPNTPGLRALQARESLVKLIASVQAARGKVRREHAVPILVKVAPDLTDADILNISDVALETKVDGLIISNTTVDRPESLKGASRDEKGGLSGAPLFEPSTRVLSDFYGATYGKVPLIGVGGISSGADAYAKIRAGASLVQLYTAFAYEGPGLVQRIAKDLARLLKQDGFESIADAVGADHEQGA